MVTDGIFLDENIIFDEVTPEWMDFCTNTLKFDIPVYEPITIEAQEVGDEEDNRQASC
jgi:hypothetical protein